MSNYMPTKGQLGINGKILRKVHSKTDPGRNRNYEQTITSTGIEIGDKNLPKNKSPGPDDVTGKFCQMFREELMPILKTAGGGTPKPILLGHLHFDTKNRQR